MELSLTKVLDVVMAVAELQDMCERAGLHQHYTVNIDPHGELTLLSNTEGSISGSFRYVLDVVETKLTEMRATERERATREFVMRLEYVPTVEGGD